MKEYIHETWLHHLAAVIGGYMGGCAIFGRLDVFGNAATSNLILFVGAIFGGDAKGVLIRLGCFALYFFSTALYVIVREKTKADVQLTSLILTAIAFVLCGFLSIEYLPVLALYPITFAAAFQWNAFASARGYVSATIFSTNNTRQLSLALTEYLVMHDREKLTKACFFLGSLLFFHVGVVCAWFGVQSLGVRANWLGVFVEIPALVVWILKQKWQKENA